jgi:hypothetical protein
MIAIEYLEIMWQKITKKKFIEHFRKAKRKEREEWKEKRVTKLLNAIDQATKEQVERLAKISLNKVWFATHVKATKKGFTTTFKPVV